MVVMARNIFASLLMAWVFSAVQAAPVQGTDYALVTPPQPQSLNDGVAGKVEVIEFFSYGCPHCYHLNPLLNQWQQTQLPANAVLIRVPVSLGRHEWGTLVRAFYTLEASGDLQRLDNALFDAIHKEGQRLFDLDLLATWAAQNGIDAAKFRSLFNSPEVSAKAMRAEQMARDYKINGVPTLTVAGKYRAMGKDYPDMLKITRQLIDLK